MTLPRLLENNRQWVSERTAEDPGYFARLAAVHRPQLLWIGCSDARVPANVITRTEPGEMFVHRNIANQVVATDNNVLAVLQYAIEVLGVRDIIVCGHEHCGGVQAALGPAAAAHVESWLAGIRTVARLHAEELARIPDPDRRAARLVELNVIEQVYNLSRTPVVQAAWAAGGPLQLHGLVYRLEDGLLRDLGVTMDGQSLPPAVADAAAADAATPRHSVRAGRGRAAARR
jgi:carbonic anhydrase